MLVVETERLIDHIGSEKTPICIVQQWGILVNGLTTEPATWEGSKNEKTFFLVTLNGTW